MSTDTSAGFLKKLLHVPGKNNNEVNTGVVNECLLYFV